MAEQQHNYLLDGQEDHNARYDAVIIGQHSDIRENLAGKFDCVDDAAKKMTTSVSSGLETERVKVYLRVRPFSKDETLREEQSFEIKEK